MTMTTKEKCLLNRLRKSRHLHGLPPECIVAVEISGTSNSDRPDGLSYWVYLKSGYVTEHGAGCHTIHEDYIAQVHAMMDTIVEVDEPEDAGYRET